MLRILHTLAQRPGRTGSGIFLNSLIQQAVKQGHEQALITGIPKQEILDFPQIEEQYQYPVRFNTPELPFPVTMFCEGFGLLYNSRKKLKIRLSNCIFQNRM